MAESKDVRVYKASKILQSKAGVGSVEKATIEKAQKSLDENTTDFEPMAMEFLRQLEEVVQHTKSGGEDIDSLRQHLTTPVMQLKANASMFGYSLIGDLSNVMLTFLESVQKIDGDIVAILEANHKTLSAIVKMKMKGDGGEQGKAMKMELMGVCKRYMEKRTKKA